MTDPVSIIASTASIVDICIRLVRYLRDVHQAAATIEDDIKLLIREVDALNAVSSSIRKSFETNSASPPLSARTGNEQELWKHVGQNLEDCKGVAERLEGIVKEIYGKHGATVEGFRAAIVVSHRKRRKEGDLQQCRDQLVTYQNVLQILLQFINLYVFMRLLLLRILTVI
jgi:hypothetical protein